MQFRLVGFKFEWAAVRCSRIYWYLAGGVKLDAGGDPHQYSGEMNIRYIRHRSQRIPNCLAYPSDTIQTITQMHTDVQTFWGPFSIYTS